MSRTLSQEEMDEHMKNIAARAEDESNHTFSSAPSSPSSSSTGTSAPGTRSSISWTGTRNTATVVQVSKNQITSSTSSPRSRISNQNIKKWLKPSAGAGVIGMSGKKRDRSPSPIQRQAKSQRCASTSVDGATSEVLYPALTSTPVKGNPLYNLDTSILEKTVNNMYTASPVLAVNRTVLNKTNTTEISLNKTIENLLALNEAIEETSDPSRQILPVDMIDSHTNIQLNISEFNDTFSFKETLKNYISQLDSSTNILVDCNKKENLSPKQGTPQNSQQISNSVSTSIPQVQKTLPTSAEPSWIPAKEA